jgi:hypothetical protein
MITAIPMAASASLDRMSDVVKVFALNDNRSWTYPASNALPERRRTI